MVLAHDWLVGMRGGEQVLDAIARAIGGWCDVVALAVMFDDGRPHTPVLDAMPKIVARVGRLPGALRARRHLLPLYPACVADLSRRVSGLHAAGAIDLVVSTSSAAIKNLRVPPSVGHLCYCHAPARYVWTQRGAYDAGGLVTRVGLRTVGAWYRAWDRAGSAHVTRFIANSTHTQGEIARCYGRESDVLHPPARTGYFTLAGAAAEGPAVRGEHALVVAALEPYKRVEVAVEACRLAGRALRVVGDGSDAARLRRLAGAGVEFVGRVDDARLREEYRGARMLLFPQVEDFGIVAVEAQACGLPVVARRAGGALDSVIDGVTGVLYDGDDPRALAGAMARCPREAALACRANAERFGEPAFAAGITRAVRAALG